MTREEIREKEIERLKMRLKVLIPAYRLMGDMSEENYSDHIHFYVDAALRSIDRLIFVTRSYLANYGLQVDTQKLGTMKEIDDIPLIHAEED